MKNILAFTIILLVIASCGSKKEAPDVSGIKVDVNIDRFERDFFQIDSNNISSGLLKIEMKYPKFYNDYMQGILGVSGAADDLQTRQMTRIMLTGYASLYEIVQLKIPNTSQIENELKGGLKFVKYYFPAYKIPDFITFIGTLDAPGIMLSEHYIGIGLQQYAGKDFEGYQSKEVRELYPAYISRRFEPEYIPANCMKAVVTDLFPDNSKTKPLIEQMIERGKQWWMLDKFLPFTADSLKTGYTEKQLKWCEENEGLIWSYIIKNEDLYSLNSVTLQTYIGEAPFTSVFSQELSPGNIGQWVGWQIVKKFEERNPDMKPEEIMQTSAKKILEESKYKPK